MTTTATIPRLKIPLKFGSVWNSVKPYQIWYGSRYSSKSWTKAIQLLLKANSQKYYRGVFARDTQKNVRNSQYQLFKDICNRFDCFRGQFDFTDTTMKVTSKLTSNFMIGGSFEQPDSLRSVADPTDFWAEEPITRESQIKRQDFFDITGSLRNAEGVPCIFHLTFNPISKLTWIYEDFFEKNLYDDEVEILKINYDENPYCPADRVKFLERLKIVDPERYKVDGQGDWGTASEGLIYKNWTVVPDMPEPEFYGVDFGGTAPCAITQGAVRDVMGQAKKDYYVKELLYECDLTETALLAAMKRLGLRKDIPMICDSESPMLIKAIRQAGYRARKCTKYAGSVNDGIRAVRDHNLKIVTGSENLFAEIKAYAWEIGKDGKPTEHPESNAVNHLMDAKRYGLEATYRKASKLHEY